MTKTGTVRKERGRFSETQRDGMKWEKEVEGKGEKSGPLIIQAHCETTD